MEGLRITGGTSRGRKLFSPPKRTIRPASDMIRQAVFNMLSSEISGCEFYDVFAGSGVVGLEAVSRGAERAIFIEREKRQVALIQRNVAHLGMDRQTDVRLADAFLWARHFAPVRSATIVFLGPPYALCEGDDLAALLGLVETVQSRLRENDVLVFQFSARTPSDRLPNAEGWYRLRKYGKTQIGLWQRPAATQSAPDEQASS